MKLLIARFVLDTGYNLGLNRRDKNETFYE